jgi:hypothetical protein
MNLPFTLDQFLQVFAAWNTALWPLQVLATVLGVVSVVLLFRPGPTAARIIWGILSLFWSVMAIGYYWMFFTAINPAAILFGALFLLQAVLFLVEGVIRGRIRFDQVTKARLGLAGVLVAYALIVYPLIGLLVTHPYPATPLFGVAPCPTTIFTLGVLAVARYPHVLRLALIPLAWSLVGGSAALQLGVLQDHGLPLAAGLWLALHIAQRRV